MGYFDDLSPSEKVSFRRGQEIVVEEVLNAIAELEISRNPLSSYGKGQLYILGELVRKMTEN